MENKSSVVLDNLDKLNATAGLLIKTVEIILVCPFCGLSYTLSFHLKHIEMCASIVDVEKTALTVFYKNKLSNFITLGLIK